MALPASFTPTIKVEFDALYAQLLSDWKVKNVKTLDVGGFFSSLFTDLGGAWNWLVGWFVANESTLSVCWQYVFEGIEEFVNLASQQLMPGVDKKTIVLNYANQLYNAVVVPLLPLFLMPFTTAIQSVLDSMLSGAIEEFVTLLPNLPPLTPAPTTKIVTSKPKKAAKVVKKGKK